MTQRKVSSSEFVADIRSGMNNDDLQAKYHTSLDHLERLFKKLVTAGLLNQSEIDSRNKPPPKYSCSACGTTKDNSFDECPKCCIIPDIVPKKQGIIFVPNSLTPTNPDDFEKLIAVLCEKNGYKATMPPANTKGYDIELNKDHECIAVQVKNHKAKCNVAQILKFKIILSYQLHQSLHQVGLSQQADLENLQLHMSEQNDQVILVWAHTIMAKFYGTIQNVLVKLIQKMLLKPIRKPLNILGYLLAKVESGKQRLRPTWLAHLH